jgi:endonuclease YncB( thermonuclease family)
MPSFDGGRTYEVEVETVTDGDTVDVRFPDGTREEVRLIGVDTPETAANRRFERVQEWEGIDDPETLVTWGERATTFARNRLADATVTLSFDPSEPTRDEFGRLLCYIEYEDSDGASVFYNRELLATGHARVYDSGITTHDGFRLAERTARDDDSGLWAVSDPAASDPIRDGPVDRLFVPRAASVRTATGRLPATRAPVGAASTATQEPRGPEAVLYDEVAADSEPDPDDEDEASVTDDEREVAAIDDQREAVETDDGRIPLVGVDRTARVAVVGGLLIDERYEQEEGFGVDTSDFGQFTFLTNLLAWLAAPDREGDVLIDGGHGQFGVDYALSAEDVAYYRRYLEGLGIGLDQRNRLSEAYLAGGRALLVTTPVGPFGAGECERIRAFRDDGGAVILLGDATAPAFARQSLNDLAAALGSDLRLNADRVRDPTSNLDGDPTLPTTTEFDEDVPLFEPFDGAPGNE